MKRVKEKKDCSFHNVKRRSGEGLIWIAGDCDFKQQSGDWQGGCWMSKIDELGAESVILAED